MLNRSNKWLLTILEEEITFENEKKDGRVDEFYFNMALVDPKEIVYISENQERKRKNNMDTCIIYLKSGSYFEAYENYEKL